jgi:NAD(P)-dependent dehydrogenase (short-subunit alcohol dehydrogenase family)
VVVITVVRDDAAMSGPLDGKVAVVTGASRGIGKGIALELGVAGAVVYVSGRTIDSGMLPGTIGETAAEIDALGGTGVAVACDHHDDAQVEGLFDRVRADHGRLDVLVNNVYSAPDLAPWLGKPFWELPVKAWDEVIDIGVRSHYVAARFGAPLLLDGTDRGEPTLITNISSSGAIQYAHNVVYGVGKAALDKMTADMAHELRPRGVPVVSVWPGLVRTEIVMLGARTTDDGRSVLDLPGEGTFDLATAESPRFVGRGVVALATDPDVMRRSGTAETTGALAAAYGFTDVDGTLPGVAIR